MNSTFITEKLFVLFTNFDHKLKNAYVFEWESFFCDHIEHDFYYDAGEWWENIKD